jgi:sugar phosphate permease
MTYVLLFLANTVAGTINAFASLSGCAGPYAFGYLRADTGSFLTGFVVLMFCALAAGILMLLTPAAQSRGTRAVTSN